MKRTAAMLALAGLLLVTGCSSESEAHKQARDEAKTEAGYYCSMQAGITSIYSDEYARCKKEQAKVFLGEWESEHPND